MYAIDAIRPLAVLSPRERSRVFLMEDHDDALRVWRAAAVNQRVLVHVDAHHDAWWAERDADICIANFIGAALREGLLSDVYWVVPDASWSTRADLRHVVRHLHQIVRRFPDAGPVEVTPTCVRTRLLGNRFNAVPLRYLPELPAPVLLDIDTDFMLIDRVSYGRPEAYSPLPWCWPEDLLDRLARTGLQAELVTIAYSINGGYTPLEWKYLGDELALRLGGDTNSALLVMELTRAAAEAEHAQDYTRAELLYHEAAAADAQSAAPRYRLALLLRKRGRVSEARELYQQAVALDPSYRTPYRSKGFVLCRSGRYEQAESEHRRILELDPSDAYLYFGIGQALARRRQWAKAEARLRKAVELDPELPDAYCDWGDALACLGRHQEAVTAYESFLRLTMTGRRTLAAPICSAESPRRIADPQHFRVHASRAHSLEKLGQIDAAEQGYRMSLAAGDDRPAVRLGLARVQWKRARRAGALSNAVHTMPLIARYAGALLRRAAKYAWRQLDVPPGMFAELIRGVRQRVSGWSQLAPQEKIMFAQASAMLPLVALALRVLSIPGLQRLLGEESAAPVSTDESQARDAACVVRMVALAADHGLFRASCLPRTLTAYLLLRRAALPAAVHLGGITRDGVFEAHAWIECAGSLLDPSRSPDSEFVAFDRPLIASRIRR